MDSKRFVFFQQGSQSQQTQPPNFDSGRHQINNQTNNHLRRMISANDIKHTSAKFVIKLLAFGLKKIQLYSQGRPKHCSPQQPLFLKDLEESISEIRNAPLRRDRSLLLVRQSKTNHKGKNREQPRRSLEGRHWNEKAQLLDEIVGRLEGNHKVSHVQEEEKLQYGEFGKRIANLQSFMQKIKRERVKNNQPAVIYQKTIIPRANSHQLLLALELERKKTAQSKDNQVIQALQNVKSELQKVRQFHQKLLSKSSQSSLNEPNKLHMESTPKAANTVQPVFFNNGLTSLQEQRRGETRGKNQSVAITNNQRVTFSFHRHR